MNSSSNSMSPIGRIVGAALAWITTRRHAAAPSAAGAPHDRRLVLAKHGSASCYGGTNRKPERYEDHERRGHPIDDLLGGRIHPFMIRCCRPADGRRARQSDPG